MSDSGSTSSSSIASVSGTLNFSILKRIPEYNFDYRKQNNGTKHSRDYQKVGKTK